MSTSTSSYASGSNRYGTYPGKKCIKCGKPETMVFLHPYISLEGKVVWLCESCSSGV